MRLQRLVLELRPRVRLRLRYPRLDHPRAEPFELGNPLLRCVARLDLATVTDSWRLSQEADRETCQSRFGRRSLCEQRPHQRDVLDTPRHRSDRVERGAEREHALRGDEPPLRLQADDVARRGRQANRAAGVRAEREVAETGGERSSRAARGAAGRQTRTGRVVAHAVPLVVPEHAPGELREVRLAHEHRPGVEQPLRGDRRPRRNVVGVDARAVGRADARGVEEILDGERPTGQRPGLSARRARRA